MSTILRIPESRKENRALKIYYSSWIIPSLVSLIYTAFFYQDLEIHFYENLSAFIIGSLIFTSPLRMLFWYVKLRKSVPKTDYDLLFTLDIILSVLAGALAVISAILIFFVLVFASAAYR